VQLSLLQTIGATLITGMIIGVANAKTHLGVSDTIGYKLTLHIKVKKLLMGMMLTIGLNMELIIIIIIAL